MARYGCLIIGIVLAALFLVYFFLFRFSGGRAMSEQPSVSRADLADALAGRADCWGEERTPGSPWIAPIGD